MNIPLPVPRLAGLQRFRGLPPPFYDRTLAALLAGMLEHPAPSVTAATIGVWLRTIDGRRLPPG
ncbi:hypothetical protein M8494_09275 [Serratia ureilytica]